MSSQLEKMKVEVSDLNHLKAALEAKIQESLQKTILEHRLREKEKEQYEQHLLEKEREIEYFKQL